MKSKIGFKYINMSHWGHLSLLPCIDLIVNYAMPTLQLKWWIFRLDIEFYFYLPDWFMKYVWNTLNLDFSWMKKQKEEEEEEE